MVRPGQCDPFKAETAAFGAIKQQLGHNGSGNQTRAISSSPVGEPVNLRARPVPCQTRPTRRPGLRAGFALLTANEFARNKVHKKKH